VFYLLNILVEISDKMEKEFRIDLYHPKRERDVAGDRQEGEKEGSSLGWDFGARKIGLGGSRRIGG
jgi:hypothetical protein